MTISATFLRTAAIAAGFGATAAVASPNGVWIDHTGRGAVEIVECSGGTGLCGYVVWVKDSKNSKACRTQIIGNVKAVGGNTWDRGWIIDPDDNSRYSVELKPIGEDRLRVTGYMGSKLFSETMTWRRAPADLKRCDATTTAAPATPPPAPPAIARPTEPSVPQPPVVTAPEQQVTPFGPTQSPPEPRVDTSELPPIPPLPPRFAEQAPREPEVITEQPPERPARRQGSNRQGSKSRDCTLDLPYITVKYPCDLF